MCWPPRPGLRSFTCRILGVGRLIKLSAKVFARSEEFSSDKKKQTDTEPDPPKAGRKIDPYITTLALWPFRYPPDLLLPSVVVSADGDTVTHDAVSRNGFMDLPMAPATHIGLAVLRASQLIEETEDESGEDLGGSLDS